MRKFLAVVVTIFCSMIIFNWLFVAIANAAPASNDPTIVSSSTLAVGLMLVSSYVIPGLSALLTPPNWSKNVTGVISLILVGVAGFVTEWQNNLNNPTFSVAHALVLSVGSVIVALVAHKQLWEKGYADALHRIGGGRRPRPTKD